MDKLSGIEFPGVGKRVFQKTGKKNKNLKVKRSSIENWTFWDLGFRMAGRL